MAVALLTSGEGHDQNSVTCGIGDTTGASLIVAILSVFTGGPSDFFADLPGNTWTALTSFGSTAGAMRTTLYYAWNPITDSSHVLTNIASGCFGCIVAASFTGIKTSADPYNGDVTGVSDFQTSAGQTMDVGTISPANGDLVISGAGSPFGNNTLHWDSVTGFTIAQQFHQSGVTEGSAIAWQAAGAGGGIIASWDADIATFISAGVMASFAQAPAPAGPPSIVFNRMIG